MEPNLVRADRGVKICNRGIVWRHCDSARRDSRVAGTARGLEMLAALDADARPAGHHRLDAVRGHLHEMLGDTGRAIGHYPAAAEKTASLPERNYLMTKAARLRSASTSASASASV